jgi:hypothetical protein
MSWNLHVDAAALPLRRSLRGTKIPEFKALLVFEDDVNVMHAMRRLRAVFAW